MKQFILWKDQKFLLLAFGGSVIFGFLGHVLLPKLYMNQQTQATNQLLYRIGFLVLFVILALTLLSTVSLYVSRQTKFLATQRVKTRIKDMLWFCVVVLALLLLYSTLSGFLSMALHRLLPQTLAETQKKQIIELAVTQLSILLFPCMFSQYIAFSLCGRGFLQNLRMGFAALRYTYLRLLILTLGASLGGWCLMKLFSEVKPIWLQTIGLTVGGGLLGTAIALFLFPIGIYGLQCMRKKAVVC